MDNTILNRLYDRTTFSAYDYDAIAHGEEWLDSCFDLMPVDLDPKDERYQTFEKFGYLEGKLIMNTVTYLKFTDFFKIPFDASRLDKMAKEDIDKDLLSQFYCSFRRVPSEILIAKLTFSSDRFYDTSCIKRPDEEIFGHVYYKL